tara:strand:+ start:8885 stop:9154 length:270 start_codon:yes stop_codon:yes gene_type:complete
MFVRKLSTYENAKGETRVLCTFQSVQLNNNASLFAVKLPDGAKVGSVVMQNGLTLEDAKAQVSIGQDFSDTFVFGAQVDGAIHEITLKA